MKKRSSVHPQGTVLLSKKGKKTSKPMKHLPSSSQGCHLSPRSQPVACQDISRKPRAGLRKQMLKSSSTHDPELYNISGMTKAAFKAPVPLRPETVWDGLQGQGEAFAIGHPFTPFHAGHPGPISAASLLCSDTRTHSTQSPGMGKQQESPLGLLLSSKENEPDLPPVPPLSPGLVTSYYVPDSNQIRLNQRWSGQRMRQDFEHPSAAGGR